ncbi:MAG: fused MFS/spermidine synthase [Oligoflexia bacterium]|nr:fused MFS/spermidine synthase [Oligoflexia bacterium]
MVKQIISIQDVAKGKRCYINGTIQFDSTDEGIYHEFLAALAAIIANLKKTAPINALILGGGDGFCAREILAYSKVKKLCIVDYDPEVLDIARTHFSSWNKNSLFDPRVSVIIDDAKMFLKKSADLFDLIVADFTFPEDFAGAELFTKDFFLSVKKVLEKSGVFATNAVSPEKTPWAFRSIIKTLKSIEMDVLPIEIDIPSFKESNYGSWGFVLGSPTGLPTKRLKNLTFPSQLRYLNQQSFNKILKKNFKENILSASFARPIIYPADILSMLSLELNIKNNYYEWIRRLSLIVSQFDWKSFFQEIEKIHIDIPLNLKEQRYEKLIYSFLLLLTILNSLNPDYAFSKGFSGHRTGNSGDSLAFFSDSKNTTPFRFKAVGGDILNSQLSKSLWSMSGVWAISRTIHDPTEADKNQNETLKVSLSDELHLSSNGNIFIPVWNLDYFYKLTEDKIILFKNAGEVIAEFPLENEMIATLQKTLPLQKEVLRKAISQYEQWINWTFPLYKTLLSNSRVSNEFIELKKIMETFIKSEATFSKVITPAKLSGDLIRLVPGVYLSPAGDIQLTQLDQKTLNYTINTNPEMDKFLHKVLHHYIHIDKKFNQERFYSKLIDQYELLKI